MERVSPVRLDQDEPQFRDRLLQFLSRVTFLAAAVIAFVGLVLAYRTWTLANARLPEGFPGGTLLALSDLLVRPFRGYDQTAAAIKDTGYLDFAAMLGIEVCLVACLVFATFGYLFKLLSPLPVFPAFRVGPRIGAAVAYGRNSPAAAATAVLVRRAMSSAGHACGSGLDSGHSWLLTQAGGYRRGVRRDWLQLEVLWSYYFAVARDVLGARWSEYCAGVRRDLQRLGARWRGYRAGVSRDWAAANERWRRLAADAGPVLTSSSLQARRSVRRSLRRARVARTRLYRATSQRLATTGSTSMASLAELGAGAGAALERGSSWYWSNFDAASNRVAAVASRFAVREVDEHSQQQDGAPDSTATPLSRREFLRRIRPMR